MRLGVALLLGWLVACAGGDSYTRHGQDTLFGRQGNSVWARGPWPAIHPSRDLDDVIDQLCPAIMQLPRASDGDYGQEYCGALYSLGDGIFHATYASPLGPTVLVGARKRKQCQPPRHVVDERGRPAPIADYHSHPWAPSEMSSDDRRAALQLFSIRIQMDTKCSVMKLIPYLQESRPGEVFMRRGKKWILVGYIQNEDKGTGRITAAEDD